MEILGQLWWIVTVAGIIAIAFFIPLRNKRQRERAEQQHKQDSQNLKDFIDDFGRNERITYMALPHRSARLAWLTQNHSEFMEAISRHEPDREIDSVVAFYLDIKLLAGVSTFPNRDNAIRAYRIAATTMSLNEYQEILNKRVEDQRKAVVARVMEQRKLEEARREEQKEAQRQHSQEKKNAKRYWKSLSKDQQAAFMKARGVAARKKVLRAVPSDDFELGRLYHLIMATQFSDINMNYNNDIDSCVSSASSHTYSPYSTSRYDDGGSTHTGTSHHANDSSSSYSGYSSSSDSGSSSSSDSSYSSSSDSSSSCSFD